MAAIFLIVLIDVLGLTIILPLLPFYTEHFGASPATVGLLVSTYAACQLISGPVLGQLSDRIGRKPVLLLSQCGTLAGFLLLAFAGSLPLLFLSRAIDGLTAGNLSTAQAYISDITAPRDRARSFGKIGMAFGIGFFLGPALTAFLFRYGYQAPILAASALSATSILATAMLLPGGQRHPEPHPAPGSAPASRRARGFGWRQYRELARQPGLLALFFQIFLFYFSFSSYMSGFALFAERRFRWDGLPLGPKQVGYAFTYFGLLGIIIQGFLIGRLQGWLRPRRLVFLAFLSSVAGYVLLSRIPGPLWIGVTGLMTSFGSGVLRPVITGEISGSVDRSRQGTVLGFNQSLQSVAQILAPVLSTTLIDRGWLDAWAWLPASICAIGMLAVYGQVRAARRPAAATG
jgi:MFS family permease